MVLTTVFPGVKGEQTGGNRQEQAGDTTSHRLPSTSKIRFTPGIHPPAHIAPRIPNNHFIPHLCPVPLQTLPPLPPPPPPPPTYFDDPRYAPRPL